MEPGTIFWPGWETVQLIGRGSFGAVYEIERKVFDDVEKAALKVISIPQNSGDIEEMYSDGYDEESITSTFKSHLQSIVAEYSLMRKMNGSANIVSCDDIRYVQHDDGIGWDIFIKMELLTPLTKALPADIPEKTVVKIAKDMCNALVLCKQYDIVHRDIKPQNIFVSKHGDYKLGDFGIAKTVEKTMGGTKIGTYKYMAPEVYNNQPYGCSADIYSLGLVLYWLLNKRRMPFMPLPPEKIKAGVEDDSRHRRLSGEALPAPACGSKRLKQIVLKACAYDPKERYQSAAEMLWDIENTLEKPEPETPTPTTPEPPTPTAPEPPTPTALETPTPTAPESPTPTAPEPPTPIAPEPPTPTAPEPPTPPAKGGNKPILVIAALVCLLGLVMMLFRGMPESNKKDNDSNTTRPVTQATQPKQSTEPAQTESSHVHQWAAATTSAPQTCITCGTTQGEPLEQRVETATGIIDVAVGGWTTYALTSKGRVYAIGENQYGQSNVSYLSDVVDIAAGDGHVALLHKNGTVSTVGHWQNGQGEVTGWRDIVAIDASSYCTVGIRKNGTVVLAGGNPKVSFDVYSWTNIVQVAATDYFIVGLRSDGTVVYTGGNGHEGQASYPENSHRYSPSGKANEIATWRDIVQVAAGRYHTLGLRSDGTVVATTSAYGEFPAACNVSGWKDIVAICAGSSFSVGLRKDGTVVIAGDFCDKDRISIWSGNISTPQSWRNVIQITAFYNQIVGLTKDGYVVACGFNSSGLCNVDNLHRKIFSDSN